MTLSASCYEADLFDIPKMHEDCVPGHEGYYICECPCHEVPMLQATLGNQADDPRSS